MTTDTIKTLPCMSTSMDGAHCGLGDWYPKIEAGITEALKGKGDWTTGWYASKKEIASARITRTGDKITVEVSVSDDLDTEGLGEVTIPSTDDVEEVRKVIYKAWDEAQENQKDNAVYVGFAIFGKRLCHGIYSGGVPQDKGVMRDAWVETYIAPRGIAEEWPEPPGDNYHQWGFQGETELPEDVKEKIGKWINDFLMGEAEGKEMTCGGYTVKPWKD